MSDENLIINFIPLSPWNQLYWKSGESGNGCYHGRYSFETFSHQKAVLRRNFNPILGTFFVILEHTDHTTTNSFVFNFITRMGCQQTICTLSNELLAKTYSTYHQTLHTDWYGACQTVRRIHVRFSILFSLSDLCTTIFCPMMRTLGYLKTVFIKKQQTGNLKVLYRTFNNKKICICSKQFLL